MTEREAVQPDLSLKLARVFIEASKSYYLILFLFFSSARHPKNLKPAVHGHKVMIQFYMTEKQIFIW